MQYDVNATDYDVDTGHSIESRALVDQDTFVGDGVLAHARSGPNAEDAKKEVVDAGPPLVSDKALRFGLLPAMAAS